MALYADNEVRVQKGDKNRQGNSWLSLVCTHPATGKRKRRSAGKTNSKSDQMQQHGRRNEGGNEDEMKRRNTGLGARVEYGQAHQLRAAFAPRLAQTDIGVSHLQDLMRHKNIATTKKHYIRSEALKLSQSLRAKRTQRIKKSATEAAD